ncbi:chitinase family 18 [Microterricola viridarii]|uniref:Chitinase family 18 n=1 Tax=Microterricola viridarii TaxID=412690 RepID=A0A1H1Z306_9MICO|nr:chitinase family 18 [Microterricola viridarii]
MAGPSRTTHLRGLVSRRFPDRRLSLVRLTILIGVLTGLVFAGFQGWKWFENETTPTRAAWFAGYVDVTATPQFGFEQPRSDADKNVVLSFVVASPDEPCTPTWGGAYTLDEAKDQLDLDRRLARLRQQGGEAMVSFGGQLNDELAVSCTNTAQLKKAYASVLDRYELDAIDLDIEGEALGNTEANARRASAIAALQTERAAAGSPLAVWLTLPVTPDGLSPDGTTIIADALAAGVDLTGVNIMTMDYGQSKAKNQSMGDAAEAALTSTQRQLRVLYDRASLHLTDATLWAKLGATPMIGQNDIRGEIFTLEDAAQLNAFALAQRVGRLSMWSSNRDATCGPNYDDVTRVSDACSGVDIGESSFSAVLGAGLVGTPDSGSGVVTESEPLAEQDLTDDPKTSPYPIWDADVSYREGSKVVWHRKVYQAKWWTKGEVPDNPVLQSFETPWTLIGPVLPGETPIPVPTLEPGTLPEWSGSTVYEKGARVLLDGLPYEAKWWTQGDSPQAAETEPDSSPWLPLDAAAVLATLATDPPAAG